MAGYSAIKSLVGFAVRRTGSATGSSLAAIHRSAFAEDVFRHVLTLERRRAERSRKPFVLMLIDAHEQNGSAEKSLHEALPVLVSSTRESDLVGWYKNDAVLGVIFTEIGEGDKMLIAENLLRKIRNVLQEKFGEPKAAKMFTSVHVFPEDWDQDYSGWVADEKLYPKQKPKVSRRRIPGCVKRAIDIVGSAFVLFLTFPVLVIIALAIKLTSRGPVLFGQERLGQFGARFKCLKLRTMYTNSEPKIHQEYIRQFITGTADKARHTEPHGAVYKITSDPRVTPIGRFLRKTSLDEFPQFWNVLRGEMSLVGPRPPVPYEFQMYDIWHRRRVLELKPGVTGLWQVTGRSRLRFDDMVRLDLRYHKHWSLWLDLKIIAATPWAVFSGDGAC